MQKIRVNLVFFLSIALAACGGGGGGDAAPLDSVSRNPQAITYNYTMPLETSDGWAVGHVDDHGIDSAKVSSMMQSIMSGGYNGIDSIAIVRDGTLVLYEPLRTALDEWDDWIGNTDLQRHVMHSTSKSVTSALIGIAIDKGFIASTDVPFYDLFTYLSYEQWDQRKSTMTLENALTMRLGMQWDEWSFPYGDPQNSLTVLTRDHDDWAKALLDLPIVADPGTDFVYNTAATTAIGQALHNKSGITMAGFAEMYLFRPLQISAADWAMSPTGLPIGGSGLFLRTRDMVKFGYLYVNGGRWQGEQIISEQWVTRSVERHVDLDWANTSGYGYQWWLDKFTHAGLPIESYSTRGFGGQYIFCIPSLDLVVAFTGHNYTTGDAAQVHDLVQRFIIDAIG